MPLRSSAEVERVNLLNEQACSEIWYSSVCYISAKRARDGHVGRPPSIPLNLKIQIVQYAVDIC